MTDRDDEDVNLPAAAIVAVNQGRFIEAIKLTREAEPQLRLAEAKQRVEDYVARDPMLKARMEQQQAETKRKVVRWSIVIDVVIVAALVWYFFLR